MSNKNPFAVLQSRVMGAEAMCRALAVASESSDDIDFYAALIGLADQLETLVIDLDPGSLQVALLPSEKVPEVLHG